MRDLDALADELVGDGSGDALPPVLEIPEDAPECYGTDPEAEGWDQSECEECEVLDLCREYGRIVESLEHQAEWEALPWWRKRCYLAADTLSDLLDRIRGHKGSPRAANSGDMTHGG